MKLPTLFACMIIRNEEENLHRCLSSIRELCDEIVAVDTGSTDNSVEILRDYGAIVYPSLQMAYRKPPIWDFSFARNESLQYCQELGANWVFIIDGDEELRDIGIEPERFKYRLSNALPHIHAIGTQVHERKENDGKFSLSWWGTRFFKVGKGVFYEGIVHNRPKLIGGYAAGSNIVLYHYGYQDEKIMNGKRQRTLTLLEKRIKDDPADHQAYYYKALSLFGIEKLDEGIEAGIKSLELVGPKIDYDYTRLNFVGILYYAIGWAYFRKWEITKNSEFVDLAYKWWMTGYEKWPDDLDLNFWLTQIGFMSNNKDMMRNHGDRYLKAMEKYRQELDLPMDSFVNEYNMNDLALGPRHVHMATDKAENSIKAIMRIAA